MFKRFHRMSLKPLKNAHQGNLSPVQPTEPTCPVLNQPLSLIKPDPGSTVLKGLDPMPVDQGRPRFEWGITTLAILKHIIETASITASWGSLFDALKLVEETVKSVKASNQHLDEVSSILSRHILSIQVKHIDVNHDESISVADPRLCGLLLAYTDILQEILCLLMLNHEISQGQDSTKPEIEALKTIWRKYEPMKLKKSSIEDCLGRLNEKMIQIENYTQESSDVNGNEEATERNQSTTLPVSTQPPLESANLFASISSAQELEKVFYGQNLTSIPESRFALFPELTDEIWFRDSDSDFGHAPIQGPANWAEDVDVIDWDYDHCPGRKDLTWRQLRELKNAVRKLEEDTTSTSLAPDFSSRINEEGGNAPVKYAPSREVQNPNAAASWRSSRPRVDASWRNLEQPW